MEKRYLAGLIRPSPWFDSRFRYVRRGVMVRILAYFNPYGLSWEGVSGTGHPLVHSRSWAWFDSRRLTMEGTATWVAASLENWRGGKTLGFDSSTFRQS